MPNNALIGAVRVEATLDAGKFVDGARKIQLASKQTEATVKSSFSGLGSTVKAGIAGFVGALSIGLFTKIVKDALDYAASLKTVSAQLGVTTKFLQEFRYAAGQVGIKQAEADKGLEQFNLNLSKAASGSERAQKAFEGVGVKLADITTKSKPEILGQIADQMIKQGGAAKNAAAGNAIFGEGFSKLVPLLDQGSAGINGLRDAAERLGIVLSDQQIQHADETAAKLEDLKNVLNAEIASTVTANANSIFGLAKAIADLTGEILHFLGSNPQLALGIIGALAGSRFGLPGAAIGAIGGIKLGQRVAQSATDSNLDVSFRAQQVRNAKDALARARAAPDVEGRAMPGIGIQASAGGEKNVREAIKELNRQTSLLNQAVASAGRSAAGNAPLPQFLARTPRTPRTPRARTPRARRGPTDRSDDLEFQFDREQMQADRDILQAKLQLAHSNADRVSITLAIIELEKQMQRAEIEDRVRRAQRDFAEGRITKDTLDQVTAQAAILQQKNDEVTRLKQQAVIDEQLQRKEEATFEAQDQRHRFALDALHAADDAATTQADHRRIQLQILDAEIEQRRLELEHQKQLAIRNGATAEEIKVIQDKIDHLGAERAQGAAGVAQGTRNPLEAWAASVPKTKEEIIGALQEIEAKGLDQLSDSLTNVLMGTESLKDAFHDLAASVLADLLKMTIKMLLFQALSQVGGPFGLKGAGAAPPGFAHGGSILVGNGPLPGFATGGSFTIGGRSGTDRNVLSLNGLPIARVSYGERINVTNDNEAMSGMGGVSLTMHNDFRGADPSAVAAIKAHLDELEASLPSKIAGTMKDVDTRTFGNWRSR